MDFKTTAQRRLDDVADPAIELSHRIHGNPELSFAEYEAATLVAETLQGDGFTVQQGVAGLPTALAASYGTGELVVGLFAEYDALPDIGHACGHNIIAASAVTAARVLAPLADQLGITVKLFGTPAEEAGGGKVIMLEQGVFDELHAAMMVHPAPRDVAAAETLAVAQIEVSYTGKTAHASAAPEKGINAADALTVAQVGIGLLRQHLPARVRVHGIVSKGGEAPNIVPGHTSGRFNIRAETMADLDAVRPRVEACFTAGAIATGCEATVRLEGPIYSEFDSDAGMHELYQANAEKLGRSFYVDPDRATGSTDMANVSLVVPTIHPAIGLDCGDAVNHQPEFTAYCAQPTGDKAVLDGALAMAWTVIDLATQPEQRTRLLARTTTLS
ncbi:MAG TPA: M20 family metallopeptidase [Jatrophihabitantaceae bacterium]